jgi:hypothetical protein
VPAAPSARPWWRIAWYPAVFPAAIIVQAWSAAVIHPAALYRPLIVGVVVTLLVTLALSALCRNRDLGALAAMAIVLWVVAAAVPAASLVLLPTAVLILAVGLAKRGRPWPIGERVTRLMSAVAAIVALAVVISMLQSGALSRAAMEIARDAEGRGPVGAAVAGAPDIYVILLDGYPGERARALDPSYPASDLGARLRERGFDMAPVTHTNYLQTSTTVTSLFQMRHLVGLPELAPPWGPEPKDVQRLRMLLNDAPALGALRRLGYRSIATASGFAEVELRRVDRLVEPPQPNEFEVSLIRGTGLGRIVEAAAPDLLPALQRDRIISSFADLEALAAEAHDGPRFVFAHLPAPHPPWVFGPNGEPRRDGVYTFYNDSARDRQVDRITAFRQALDQAEYTDRLVIEAVDAIRDASPAPPVIVVFSDHGTGTGFDHLHPLESDLVERTSNILAASTPGHPGLFAEPATPVNIVPMLLRAYFDRPIPLNDDSVWAWRDSKLDFVRQPQLEP